MSSDRADPTEGAAPETPPCRPLGRQLALDATLHGIFGVGGPPEPKIARYAIVRRLGAGGMSEVFLADDPKLRRRVAIKVLNQHFDAGDERRLMREGWALASVRHPGVVAVHDVGVADGRAFLVMEHVEGVTLDAWLAASPRPLVEVLRRMIPICEGLAEVHARGVVHRDLKPSNILVDAAGRARVIDFGLVVGDGRGEGEGEGGTRALVPRPGALTRDGALAGTPAYMSPEQAAGAALDGRSDLFSLAIVVYEAAYGGRPFVGAGLGVLQAILGAPPRTPRRRGIRGRMLWRVLRRALARRPEDRYPDMRALGAALQRVVDRPRQAAWALALALALAAAVLVGLVVPREFGLRACWAAAGPWPALAEVGDGPLGERLRGYHAAWSGSWERACAAAHRGGDLSVDVGLPLRQACLREAQGVVEAALGRLGSATGDDRAERERQLLLAELPSIAACEASAAARGRRPHALAEDEAVRAVLSAVQEAEARFLVGEVADAEAAAREAVARAEALRHRWTRARARAALGQILRRTEAPDAAATVALLRTAADEAIADHDRILAIRALHEAARGAVLLGHDAGEAKVLLARAEAERIALDGLAGSLGPELEASEWDIRGLVAYEEGAREEAVRAHQQAVEVLEKVGARGDEGQRLLAAAYLNLGRALGEEDTGAARQAFDRAYAIAERIYGSDHAALAVVRHSQALAAHEAGDPALARQLAEEALELARGAGSGSRLQVAGTEVLLAELFLQYGEYAAAQQYALAAEESFAVLDGGRGVELLQARRIVALSLHSQGDHDAAERVEVLLEEQCLHDDTLKPEHRAEILLDRATGKIDGGTPEEALRLLDELKDLMGENEHSSSALVIRGWALLTAGRETEAISFLEEGIVGLTSGNHRAERARSEWALAEALITTGGDPRRICDLLNACRGFYAAPGGDPETLASLDEIRAAQRCRPSTPEHSETKP